jgi:hypothetical protein
MSEQSTVRHGSPARRLTWTLLALVPVLGVAALGSAIVPSLTAGTSPAVPGGLLVGETRELAQKGDDLTALTAREQPKNLDQFLNDWQNTVRRRASPRR